MASERVQRRIEQFLDAAEEAVERLDWTVIRDRARAVQQAMSLLDESLAISSELGMRPLMERVLSRRDFLKA